MNAPASRWRPRQAVAMIMAPMLKPGVAHMAESVLLGAPPPRKVWGQSWLLITPVYPSETCPLGPISWQKMRTDRAHLRPGDGPQRADFRWINGGYE